MKFAAFLLLTLTLTSASFADSMSSVGSSTDVNGTVLSVAKVELGRDRYLAVSITEADKEENATAFLLLSEVAKARKLFTQTANSSLRPKAGEVEIIGGFPGENEEIHFMVVNFQGVILPVAQVRAKGKERTFVLSRTNSREVNALLKKAAR